jgi:uncharacterized membrane protein/protein-disulfide isomerase
MNDNPSTGGSAGGAAWWAMLTLAAGALAITVLLTAASITQAAGPPGCGAGSGCGEVLGSKWSRVVGVPVSLPAAGLYVLVIGALFTVRPSASHVTPPFAWSLLTFAAVGILAAAAWFTYLQAAVIGAWCPYCMVDHGLGVALAGVILASAPRRPVAPMAMALVAVGGVALTQLLTPASLFRADHLGVAGDFDAVGPERRVGLLDGQLQLDLAREAVLGSTDAPHVVAVLFDYACPHCRRTHEALDQHRANVAGSAGEVVVVALPTPLHPACNTHAPDDPPDRFASSCEIARLTLAVAAADRAAFEAFDRWMFEPMMPRSLDDARAKAAELVGQAALDEAMNNPAIDAMIARNVEAYGLIGEHRRLPVVLVPGQSPVIGSVDDAGAFARLLRSPTPPNAGGSVP